MITNLHIKNIGIIDNLEIELNQGFNVLTGETGSGKTLIIDALSIISGERFSKEMIRKGENNSFVELSMYCPNNNYLKEKNIIVSREIYANGRNLCKINGRLVTVSELKNFMKNFLEIHGQNDNQQLLDNKIYLQYLDNFIGDKIKESKEIYINNYKKYIKIKEKLKESYGDDKEKQRKLDLLKYQLNEIEQANLKTNEEEILEEKRKFILNSEKIIKNLNDADNIILNGGIDCLSEAIRALEKIENIDVKYKETNLALKNIYYELQEAERDISSYKENIYFDEFERTEIEQRLDLLFSLKRKYGNTIEEILKYKKEVEKEIETIQNLEEYNLKLKKELNIIQNKMIEEAQNINSIRVEYAKILSNKINKELKDLEMKNATINIIVKYNKESFFDTGKDEVNFKIRTNIGENEHNISKIASGGEMSRVMLAIKKVLAETDQIPILVFDEVDTGISGMAANTVANKLKAISNTHQVLCVSHLASIAAKADFNYYISKKVIDKKTKTNIKLLNEKEVIEEIARISAGEVNEITLKYANELRNKKVS